MALGLAACQTISKIWRSDATEKDECDARGLQPPDDIKASSDRSFGLVMAGFFLIIAALAAHPRGTGPLVGAGVAAMFAVLALLWPPALAPLNKRWMKFGLLLSSSSARSSSAYCSILTVTPIALLMRASGQGSLRLRREPDATSYWIERTPRGRRRIR